MEAFIIIMGSFISKTVEWILKTFDEEKITYAILRNYELLPEIGHDLDMICRENDFAKVRKILKMAKDKYLWNDIVEVKLWESYIDDFTIKVFKIFDFEREICLQIDFFGGYTIWSAPAVSLESLLKRRVRHKFYYKISKLDEILIRSMQLSCAIRGKQNKRIIKLKKVIKSLGGLSQLDKAYERLPTRSKHNFIYKEGVAYRKGYEKYQHSYFLFYFLKSPISCIFRFLERIRYRLKSVTWAIPGILVFIEPNSYNINKSNIKIMLDSWQNGQIIPGYSVVTNYGHFIKYYKYMISGFLIIIPSHLSKQVYTEKLFKSILINKFIN